MTKKNYSKYEAKEELVTLSFNHVLLHKKDTKIYQVIFLSLLTRGILWKLELFIVKPCFASNLRLETSVNPNLMYIVCFHNFHRGTTPNNMYHSETSFFI